MMRDLGFAVKLVLNIDAQATEHILHRQGIGKLKQMWRTCGCKMKSDHKGCECTESGVKKTSQTWEQNHSAKQ